MWAVLSTTAVPSDWVPLKTWTCDTVTLSDVVPDSVTVPSLVKLAAPVWS